MPAKVLSIFDGDFPNTFSVSDSGDGFHTVTVNHYEEFTQLLGEGRFRDYPEYVFRGHSDPSWSLQPSLYRRLAAKFFQGKQSVVKSDILERQNWAGEKTALILKHFLYGLRGTAWHEPCHELLIDWYENRAPLNPHINLLRTATQNTPGLWAAVVNTWATGQHQRLATPLLDWTESPLVAFYFAFEKHDDRRIDGEESRVVFALNRRLIEERCRHEDFKPAPLDFVTPFSRNNPRMIAQQGLFTYSHVYQTVEDWVQEVFSGEDLPVLIRFLIRDVPTITAVRWLNRHGINDRTLYPDLEGITRFSNRTIDDAELTYS